MATAIRAENITGANGEPGLWPSLESFEEAVRTARRAAVNARFAGEDFVAGASLEVRRHPLTAVGIAASTGIVTGALFGLAAGWYFARRQ